MTDQGEKIFRQSGVSGAQTTDFRHGVCQDCGSKPGRENDN